MRDIGSVVLFSIFAAFIAFFIFDSGDSADNGMSGTYNEQSYESLPEEPTRGEIEDRLDGESYTSVETMIEETFPQLDTVQTDRGRSEIYMTSEYNLQEVEELIVGEVKPRETGERQGDKQALIYPDNFVILKESEEEAGLVLIELAEKEFVRNNYSPSFFEGMLAYALLNQAFGTNDWRSTQRNRCDNGGCYGGYSMYGGNSGSFRGSSTRGGGPSVGK
ncbi:MULTISPECIES: DUF4247 domain-containing protein [Salimicrobium]|uniref:DUF4247 domain-containing protein n=1 Tax=Salimicrobium humidisoli TaxID=2029857 RepID=A0ABX4HVG8_9BACI|nr:MULTISPECIES: DUF4247 domain-containing protein [Salimicrobium]PBB06700.1 hypothetical protein CKW00_01435 [Salimicrobium humidisoli]